MEEGKRPPPPHLLQDPSLSILTKIALRKAILGTKSALSKTGRFLRKTERVGVGGLAPLPIYNALSLHIDDKYQLRRFSAFKIAQLSFSVLQSLNVSKLPFLNSEENQNLNTGISSKRCFRKRRRQWQECVRNASKWVGKRGTFQNATDMQQNCIRNA